MKTFKDNAGRVWSLQVDVAAVKRVRSLLGLDLMEALHGKLVERLAADPVLLCDAIYCVAKPEADAKGVSDEDFGRAMAGDALDAATAAFLEELVGFFPQNRRRVLAKALAKFRAFEARAAEAAEARMESPELEAKFAAALAAFGNSSGGLPGSSGSTLPG